MPRLPVLSAIARACVVLLMAGVVALTAVAAATQDAAPAPVGGPAPLLGELDQFPHAVRVATSSQAVVDYEVGLGAMQKHLGDWQFKRSERVDGERLRYTWQITDGFSSEEVFQELVTRFAEWQGSERLFRCEGRACGNGAQWANRVFGQRVLYGRADAQRYVVFRASTEAGAYLMLAYASARTADRQYLHAEVVALDSKP
ncbi:DUF4892 domain-containing protein [Parahaliea mediterranea]|uniref:DUF4892 domain-containing protein n=1 Tax=Parahaliea mediterranea TaxID=651086 RepID=UPI0013001AEC|nr:DUF4892 domain-containing protein [Parahaliea mediterranea]